MDKNKKLLEAVKNNDLSAAKKLLKQGAEVNTRDPRSSLTLLMIASGYGNAKMVKLLLANGADVFMIERYTGASALHKSCQGGNVAVAKLLVKAGAFVDLMMPTMGYTPLLMAIWFKNTEMVKYLLDCGASLNLKTHYGFSLAQHFDYEINVNTKGSDKIIAAKKLVDERNRSDEEQIKKQELMAAVNNNDVEKVRQLIAAKVKVDEVYPIVNGFSDGNTPLLIAARDGRTEIVDELLKAGADPNAVDPTFGSVPLHKAVYNGNEGITRLLAKHPKIDLDFQGPSNGYTPLHDALWHGHTECAKILVEVGARLDLKGHEGKLPVDIAAEIYGADSEMTRYLDAKAKEKRLKKRQ